MVKSLLQLCTAVCIKNIKEITDVGSTPYSVLRPILLKVDNARQLRQLEVNSPHLEGDDAECWIRLIARDFPVLSEKHKFEPRNPSLWHRVYKKYKSLEEEQKREAEEKLKNAFAGIKKEKEGNTSQIINFDGRRLPRPPRDDRSPMGFRGNGAKRDSGISGLRFTGGSRTKTNNAQSILKRAIREAKEIGARNRLNTPTGQLIAPTGQIARPPQAMVKEHINKARPLLGSRPAVRPPVRPSSFFRDPYQEALDARLLQIKNQDNKNRNKKTANYISDDDLEEDDDLDDDLEKGGSGGGGSGCLTVEMLEGDLFDEDESSSNQPPFNVEDVHFGPSPSRLPPSSSTVRSRPGGILSRKPPGSIGLSVHKTVIKTVPQPTAKPKTGAKAISPPITSTSPPKSSSAQGSPAAAGESKPPMPRKRKAVDIFMKPKPKAARQ
ncbi:RNA polymerase II transcription factor SIII subunit A-domain-containing protein [Biscogniauxia sp. FL1348]|nr:RNA polymerase II transcription factor SIII subunit A-domain-containing protein [Biscogniauxia sp. FL1348]